MTAPRGISGHNKEFIAVTVGLGLIMLVALFFVGRTWWQTTREDERENPEASVAPFDRSDLPLLSASDLQSRIRANEPLNLIDIRTPEAYQRAHIPDSISIAPEGLANYTPTDTRPVILIPSLEDEAGTRIAYDIIKQKTGTWFFLEGGFEGWRADAYPVITQGDPASFIDQSKVTYISPEELKALLSERQGLGDLFLLDVQSAGNYARVHLVGSINIPLDELEKRRQEIPAGRDIVVYGENELASFQGGVRLSDLGFFSVRTLTGNAHLSPDSPLFRAP